MPHGVFMPADLQLQLHQQALPYWLGAQATKVKQSQCFNSMETQMVHQVRNAHHSQPLLNPAGFRQQTQALFSIAPAVKCICQ
jgi:hypothetical protein